MITLEQLIPIGYISKPHGLQGCVELVYKDEIYTDWEADFLFLEKNGLPVPYAVEEIRVKNHNADLIQFVGVNNDQEASQLKGLTAYLFPENLVVAEENEDEISLSRFVGFTLKDEREQVIGKITHIDTSSLNTLLEVDANGKNLFIPFHEDLLIEFIVEKKELYLKIPEGLLSILND